MDNDTSGNYDHDYNSSTSDDKDDDNYDSK